MAAKSKHLVTELLSVVLSGMTATPLLIIGGGNMGCAIVVGGLGAAVLDASCVGVAEPVDGQRGRLVQAVRAVGRGEVAVFASARQGIEWLAEREVQGGDRGQILLAVKPQMLAGLASEIGTTVGDRVVITILAGTPGAKVQAALGVSARIVRAMPNLPASIRRAATAVCKSDGAREGDDEFALRLFRGIGPCVVSIEERLMNAFTGLAGSGPAYVFYLAEAMIDAAERMGFDRNTASKVVRQTIEGSGALLAESTESPGALRASVTSKGGTTQAAMSVLEQHHVKAWIVEAILAAEARGSELARL